MVEWTQISDLYCRVLYGEVIKNTLMQDPFNITINYQRIYFNGHFLAVKLLYNSKCPSMTFLFVCLMFFSEIFFLTTLVTEHLLNNSLCPFVLFKFIKLGMLELSYRFPFRFDDSWYNDLQCRKRSNFIILTKKVGKVNMLIFNISY